MSAREDTQRQARKRGKRQHNDKTTTRQPQDKIRQDNIRHYNKRAKIRQDKDTDKDKTRQPQDKTIIRQDNPKARQDKTR